MIQANTRRHKLYTGAICGEHALFSTITSAFGMQCLSQMARSTRKDICVPITLCPEQEMCGSCQNFERFASVRFSM